MTTRAHRPLRSALRHIVSAIVLTTAGSGGVTQGVTVEEITDSWKKHAAATKSIQYECELTRTEWLYKGGSNDPFGQPPPGATREQVTLKGKMTFSIASPKIAWKREGEYWDDNSRSLRIQTHRRIFDGKQNRSLSINPRALLGTIEESAVPYLGLVRNTELDALWFSYSPTEVLTHPEAMAQLKWRLAQEEFKCGDSQCLQLSAQVQPRQDVDLLFCLYVEVDGPHRPIMWTQARNGVPNFELLIKYEATDASEWRVAEFTTSSFGRDEKDEATVVGIVTKCSLNEPLNDAVFTIDFPDGTSIGKDGKAYIQKAGKLVPKDEKEQQPPPPSGDL